MKTLVLIISFFLAFSITKAQKYENAAGIRGGSTSGIFYQNYLNDTKAVEVILSWRDEGMQVTGLYEIYKPIWENVSDKFFFYYGAGGHAGYTRWHKRYYYDDLPHSYYYKHKTTAVMGFDGIAGIEFRLNCLPLTFSLDYKPYLEMFGKDFIAVNLHDIGFGAKFMF